jgi:hypothetical protein
MNNWIVRMSIIKEFRLKIDYIMLGQKPRIKFKLFKT